MSSTAGRRWIRNPTARASGASGEAAHSARSPSPAASIPSTSAAAPTASPSPTSFSPSPCRTPAAGCCRYAPLPSAGRSGAPRSSTPDARSASHASPIESAGTATPRIIPRDRYPAAIPTAPTPSHAGRPRLSSMAPSSPQNPIVSALIVTTSPSMVRACMK